MTDEQIKGIARAINPHWWNDDIDLLDFARSVLARAGQNRQSSGESHADSLKSSEQARALVLADALEATHPAVWPYGQEAAAMLRKLYVHNTELENSLVKKSISIQKIWKERDDLRQRVQADEYLLHRAAAMLSAMPVKHPQQGQECDALITAINEALK